MTTKTFQLSAAQREAEQAAARARGFVEAAGYGLGVAMIDHAWNGGPAEAVIEELARYQNGDGGFGRGLEVDIGAPASNPFATRLAMIILLDLDDRPSSDLETNLQQWLINNQHDDGDWHFSDETKAGDLALWFTGWTFPSLNPACCLAGLSNRLDLATPPMLQCVARLFAAKATLEEARIGDFYTLLPYAEYAGGVDWADRERYLDAVAANIVESEGAGKYADAGHFWEHVLGGGSNLAGRIPAEILARNADRLLTEQIPDGGWPTPYNEAWRPWTTAQASVTLARLRDGI